MTRLQKIAAALRERNWDAVLIAGGENLCYATGFVGLEGMVFVTKDGKGFCHTDSRYIEAAEAAITPEGYQVCMPEESYPEAAATLAKKFQVKLLAFEDRVMPVSEYEKYREAVPSVLTCAGDLFETLREVKEETEVARIVAAQRIAEDALRELLPMLKPGAVERELAAELDYLMAKRGSTGVSFPTILVSGTKSSMPHGVPGEKKLEDGDFVTIDFGAMVGGYHSDMTRTFAIGHATDEMKKVYNIVLQAQLTGIEAMEVGKSGRAVDAAARDIIEQAGYGRYFGHGLGHSLGLNIHENPRASRIWEPLLKQGNVVTVEPGIYLPGKFGVRIEDMVYLGVDGKRNLTEFPKELMIL